MGSIVERALLPWAQRVKSRVNLPVRLSWGERGASSLSLGEFDAPQVEIRVRDASALPLLIDPGLDTLGQAYVEGLIDVDGSMADILAVAHRLAETAEPEAGLLGRLRRRFAHTRESDSQAIQYHYDVSNAFYAQWLDERMVYSCGYFENGDETLDEAQLKKIDHILTKIQLQPGQRLLDIGCGWGALVLRAAQKFGAHCVGVTLSKNQHELARERVKAAGLEDRIDIRLQDYRDVNEKFDRIVSVGMLEHVGLKSLRGYFAAIRKLLADGGVCLNHGITSTDADSAEAPFGGGDFIERYVFPHGELPHIGFLLKEMAAAGLEATDVENLRRHYALTARHWSRRFERHGEQLRALVGEKRYRIWRTYLAGCAYGFGQGWIALHQVLAVKAEEAGTHPLPLTRDYMYAR